MGLTRKYLPGTYQVREEEQQAFFQHLSGDRQCIALVGGAGTGKTNLMCHLTESLLGTHVPLFFNAPELDQDIIKTIQGDFNWVFSPQLTPKEVLDRLSSIAASLGKKVVQNDPGRLQLGVLATAHSERSARPALFDRCLAR